MHVKALLTMILDGFWRQDSNGTLWFELQRELSSIYYQRIDFVDVQMYHPVAWGFPDASKIVTPSTAGARGRAWRASRRWRTWTSSTP